MNPRPRFWRPMSVPLDHAPLGSVRERTAALGLLSSLAQHEIELVPGPGPLTARHEPTVSQQSPWPDSNWRAASCSRVPMPLGHRGRGRGSGGPESRTPSGVTLCRFRDGSGRHASRPPSRRTRESNSVRCHPRHRLATGCRRHAARPPDMQRTRSSPTG